MEPGLGNSRATVPSSASDRRWAHLREEDRATVGMSGPDAAGEQPHPAPHQEAAERQRADPIDDAPRQADANRVRTLALVAGFGAVVGLSAAALAAVFLELVHTIEGWLWHDLPTALGASSPW